MGYRIGSGYFGSDSVKTSLGNDEIIQQHKPAGWVNVNFMTYKFSFLNRQNCTIKINDGAPIYLEAYQGFKMSEIDMQISKFEVVQAGIDYNYAGAF